MKNFAGNLTGKKNVIIFMPHAGGSGEFYIPWFKNLKPHADCLYATLAGRGARMMEEAVDDINKLVSQLAEELFSFEVDKEANLIFWGHSMGALLAFELAKKLAKEYSIDCQHLFLSGHRAPNLPLCRQYWHSLDDATLYAKLTEMGGVDSQISFEVFQPFISTVRADLKLCETYNYDSAARLTCPATIYWGEQDEYINKENMPEWQQQFKKKVRLKPFMGDHFYHTCQRVSLLDDLLQVLQEQKDDETKQRFIE